MDGGYMDVKAVKKIGYDGSITNSSGFDLYTEDEGNVAYTNSGIVYFYIFNDVSPKEPIR